MEPTKRQIQKWVKALRSGKYKQTRGTLQDYKGYCCLGVACKIFISKNKQIFEGKFIRGKTPRHQRSPQWLLKISTDFYEKIGVSLSCLNDWYKYSFDEIADLLELVYIHKALD